MKKVIGYVVAVGCVILGAAVIGSPRDECLEYTVTTTEVSFGRFPTQPEVSRVRVVLGRDRGRLDAGDTSYIVRDRKLLVVFHRRKQYWELDPSVKLEAIVSEEGAKTLARARPWARARVEVEARGEKAVRGSAPGAGHEGERYWAFKIVQGGIGLDQELELWTERAKPRYERSFWKVVGAAAAMSVLQREWFERLPSISGIPSRVVLEVRMAWEPEASEKTEATASACEASARQDVYAVPAGYERVAFELPAIFAISGEGEAGHSAGKRSQEEEHE